MAWDGDERAVDDDDDVKCGVGWWFDRGDSGDGVVVKCGEVEGGEWMMVAAEFGGR